MRSGEKYKLVLFFLNVCVSHIVRSVALMIVEIHDWQHDADCGDQKVKPRSASSISDFGVNAC